MINSKVYDINKFPTSINLGCGKDVFKNFINVDKFNVNYDVMKLDLFKKGWHLNFEKDYFDFIYSNHFFEHVPDTESFLNLMEGIFYIAKNKSTLEIRVPYPYSKTLKDMDHYRLIDVSTFKRFMDYYTNSLTGSDRVFLKYLKLKNRFAIGQYHIKKYLKINIPPYYALHLVFKILEY